MNLTKYITLNIIAFLGNIWFIFLVYNYISIELYTVYNLDFPIPRIHDFLSYLWYFCLAIIIFHLLFIIEVIARIKKPKLIPETKIPHSLRIIHPILFYFGWVLTLFVIFLVTKFIIDVESSDFNRYLNPIPFDTTLD